MFESREETKRRILGVVQDVLREKLQQLRLLGDTSQFNRRIRRSRRRGNGIQSSYLIVSHHRRRLARRSAIRQLVEGPVRRNTA